MSSVSTRTVEEAWERGDGEGGFGGCILKDQFDPAIISILKITEL